MATTTLIPNPRDIPTLNIISSHKIAAKVIRVLSELFTPSPSTTTAVVALRAKAAAASKAITIAEIVKRRMAAQNEQWYQYTTLTRIGAPSKSLEPTKDVEAGGDDHDEEDPFMPMPTTRFIPVITIYLSRTPLPAFASAYGEQTGGGEGVEV